jgi:hypothetical protein
MKPCRVVFLAVAFALCTGATPFDSQTSGAAAANAQQDYEGNAHSAAGQQDNGALAQNAAMAPSAVPSVGVKVYRTIRADVVAIDQPYVINRLGASQPGGMIFVLKSDLVPKVANQPVGFKNFKLRPSKRPRPIVLRMNVGDLLEIHFENWLQSLTSPAVNDGQKTQDLASKLPFKQLTRYAGIHVNGLDLVPQTLGGADGIKSDGSSVGTNASSLLPPRSTTEGMPEAQSITYRLYARDSGTFLLTSGSDTTVHQLNAGLFGAVNVQPRRAEWYRSQTTRCEMEAAQLEQGDLRYHEQALGGDYVEPVKFVDQDQAAPAVEEAAPPDRPRPRSLTTTARGSRAQVVAPVYVENVRGTPRFYSNLHQPLINYFAVFAQKDVAECPTAVVGKPILSMLKVTTDPNAPKVTINFVTKAQYTTELKRFDDQGITFLLRDRIEQGFNIKLDPDATIARVADANEYSWVVNNPGPRATRVGDAIIAGKSYLVQGVPNSAVAARADANWDLTIQECGLTLVHSDLTALITGPNAGNFPYSQDGPEFFTNPASPERRQPYREFTIIYHQGGNTVQAFAQWSNNNLFGMINAGMDQFGINYGIAAIGPEIVANRLGVGPMGNNQQPPGKTGSATAPQANQPNDAVDLKYEEFFLSSWSVGDPAMIVDVPANAPNQMVDNPDKGSAIIGAIENNPVQFGNFKPLAAQTGTRPTKAFYPDDPSNVYHSYMRDHTKMRILHAGPGPAHVHHLHAHQWLKTPNSPESTYLDSQLIIPGSAYTLEITYNGSGNRNQTVGDSIFHCHFYPHFAKGMWSLWRVHDTFEDGTELDQNGVWVTGKPNRALPDGEIAAGTPTPAVIPVPTLGMAPMPAPVQVTDLSPWYSKGNKGMGRRIHVVPRNWSRILRDFDKDHDGTLSDAERAAWYKAIEDAVAANKASGKKYGEPGYVWVPYALYDNPGYPFFVPGVSGHRPPHPPLDMAWKEDENREKVTWTDAKIQQELGLDPTKSAVKPGDPQFLDGGLPRHVVLGGDLVTQYTTRWDFSKDFVKTVNGAPVGGLYAFQLPEDGTPIEKAAMRAHSKRTHATTLPIDGDAGNFILNGLPPTNGAPFADPSVTEDGNSSGVDRRYQAAVIQTDVVLNKEGWHYPQSRFITLWEDVARTVSNDRAPEPFFIRTATNDATVLWHTNLVPNYYELDDFQVRTPTDVIGQHIHLVKFDVTSSDGGANGWNYEDGTFGPSEVRERIHAITNAGGLYGFDARTSFVKKESQKSVAVWPNKYAYPKRGSVGDATNGLFGPPPPNQNWEGAMTTIQRWAIDPLLNWQGHDRTLRTVFTHDHLGPSTHQQVGLYAGVLVEPQGSEWYLPDGVPMYTRVDGGPTSWQAVIVTANARNSHREYAIEFQDMALAYTGDSTLDPKGSNALFNPTSNANAPSAFYIGQAAVSERLNEANLNDFILNGLNKAVLPQKFPELFLNYGIPLSPAAKVTVLQLATFAKGYTDGQWRIDQPPLRPDLTVNGGDFYIVKASNPVASGLPPGQPQQLASCLSVFTPSIPPGFTDPSHALNPNPGSSINVQIGAKLLYFGDLGTPNPTKPGDIFGNGAPYASLVSTRANGTYSMNYRNEPVQLRVDPRIAGATPAQKDLAYAFSSIKRADAKLNVQPPKNTPIGANNPYKFPPVLVPANVPGGPQKYDPYTPLIRGYVGDDIQIRTLVGAHLEPHAFSIHGVDWLTQPSYHNSGFRNVQSMGISEHYEMRFQMPSAACPRASAPQIPDGADYFYSASTGAVGLSNGLWGIIRSYNKVVGTPLSSNEAMDPSRAYMPVTEYLKPLPNNPLDALPAPISFEAEFNKVQAAKAPVREFKVHATTTSLIYNKRGGPNFTSDAVIFVLEEDLPKLKQKDARIEPLILRAAAGEWIKVTLINDFPTEPAGTLFDKDHPFRYGNPFNNLSPKPGEINLRISQRVGLHPQLVAFDVCKANGINVGFNPASTVPPPGSPGAVEPLAPDKRLPGSSAPGGGQQAGNTIDYYWYAGEIVQKDGHTILTPVEFGATNLVGADLILQTQFGLVGALVIEPKGTYWSEDSNSRAFANIYNQEKQLLFRECVLVLQNMVANKTPGRQDMADQTGLREQGYGAVNYRTESFLARGPRPPSGLGATLGPDVGFADVFSNAMLFPNPQNIPPPGSTAPIGQPETPIFEAVAGTPVRFRVVMPSTTSANSAAQPPVFTIHGHGWQDEPYTRRSTEIGHNSMAQRVGSQEVTVTQKYDIVLDSAGGPFKVPGDYLYQAFNQEQKMGIWGLFRVVPASN